MIWLLVCVNALFILHAYTQLFIGSTEDRPLLLSRMPNAVDFRLGGAEAEHNELSILAPDGRALEIYRNTRDAPLRLRKAKSNANQAFRIVLLPGDDFIIMQEDNCLDWDESEEVFIEQRCESAGNKLFNLYYEISPPDLPGTSSLHSKDLPHMPPEGTKERELIETILKNQGNSHFPMNDFTDDINSDDLAAFKGDENEMRDIKQFLLSNRPKTRHRRNRDSDTEGMSSNNSSSSCEDVEGRMSRLANGSDGPLSNRGPRDAMNLFNASCAPSDIHCVKIQKRLKKTIEQYNKGAHDESKFSDSECSDSVVPKYLKRR